MNLTNLTGPLRLEPSRKPENNPFLILSQITNLTNLMKLMNFYWGPGPARPGQDLTRLTNFMNLMSLMNFYWGPGPHEVGPEFNEFSEFNELNKKSNRCQGTEVLNMVT